MRDLIKANAALLFAGVATFVLMGAGQSLYGPALPAFSRGFGIAIGTAGFVVSAHWVGCFVGVAGMYFRGSAVTPRHVILGMGVGAALMALSVGWWMTLLGGFVFGMGYGGSTVVFNPRVLKAFGAKGPAMVSLLNATFGIGAIVAPLVFVALGNDPALSFGLCALLALAVWLGSGPAGRTNNEAVATETQPFKPMLGILGFGLVAVGLEATLIGLGPAALIAAGETETHAAQLLSLFFFAFLAARVVLIFTAHLLPSFTLFLLAVTGTALSAAGAALFSAGAFYVLIGGFAGLFFPGFYVTASRKMGEDPRVPATIIASGLVGGIFAPLILSPWLTALGERGFFWVIACVGALLALAALVRLRSMNA